MELTFLGATGTVTGSKYLLETGGQRILVDCGLFQGLQNLRLRNWESFPIRPDTIQAVVLTHAHLDHSGYLPLLAKQGFQGPIYSSAGTRDLCEILLLDAGKLQEEDASYANTKGYSKHKPALPLFTMEDSRKVMKQFKVINFQHETDLGDGISVTLAPSGHILGSSLVTIKNKNKSILFSGDLGRPHDLIMNPPTTVEQTEFLLIESTYGDRNHPSSDPLDKLKEIINRTVNRCGVVMIPAFSVGRTQNILFALHLLRKSKRIEDVPVFLNSPMSISATHLYCDYQK